MHGGDLTGVCHIKCTCQLRACIAFSHFFNIFAVGLKLKHGCLMLTCKRSNAVKVSTLRLFLILVLSC